MGDGAEAVGDGVAAVEALGGLLGLEEEALEAVVGGAPGVPPGLAGGHALREAVEVIAAEGLHDHHVAPRIPEVADGSCRERNRLRVPSKSCGHRLLHEKERLLVSATLSLQATSSSLRIFFFFLIIRKKN